MKKTVYYLVMLLATALGIFFIYKGFNRNLLAPCKVYGADSTLPMEYQNLMTALCTTGYTKIIGVLEVLSGVLLMIPRTRLLGSIVLMPVIVNIFLFHLIIDNRPDELIETGIPLSVNILIFTAYYSKWKSLIWHSAS